MSTRFAHRRFSNLILFLGSLILCFLILEAGARILFPSDQLEYIADDEVLWRFRSSQTGWVEMRGENTQSPLVTINDWGFRGKNYVQESDRFTILALGDSYTFGSGVADNDTFCAQMESMSDNKIRVFNAGVPGWGVFQEQIILERLIDKLSPDYVLVTVPEHNIYRQPFKSDQEKQSFLLRSKVRNRLRDFSRFGTIVWRHIEQIRLSLNKRQVPNAVGDTASDDGDVSPRFRHYWKQDKLRLLSMNDLVQNKGSKLVVVAWPLGTRNTSFFLDEVANLQLVHDVNVLDLSSVLAQKEGGNNMIIPGDGHPNADAYRLVSRYILDKVISESISLED